jgi:hypothetical protein
MTPEEIQRTIEGMLSVQRELQEGQLKLQETQYQFQAEQQQLQETQKKDRETIEQMLSVQRDLQEGQMQVLDALSSLIEVSNRNERRIEQLVGYSITNESDRLDLQQQVEDLKRRVERLESQNN